MTQPVLMILGGSRYIIPLIESAHNLGCRVITCDYLPDNPAHRFSDEYVNVSITDHEAVLKAATDLEIDGIISFAADPGVVTAAFVAEALGLPFQASAEMTEILQNKDRFRGFLKQHGFSSPWFKEVNSLAEIPELTDQIQFPAIVKPVDSAGSKGVKRVDCAEEVYEAVKYALSFSKNGLAIIEQFLEPRGDSSDSDAFTIDGVFRCVSFSAQKFDRKSATPYVPSAYQMPSSISDEAQLELKSELQRLADLMGLRSGIYNIETRVATDGTPYIMEVSPRGGGNRLAEMLTQASGEDLIRATVQAALGLPIDVVGEPEYDGIWYQEMLRSDVEAKFGDIWFDNSFYRDHVRDVQLWIDKGDPVFPFSSANYAFGSVFMRFEDQSSLNRYLEKPESYMQVRVEPQVQ